MIQRCQRLYVLGVHGRRCRLVSFLFHFTIHFPLQYRDSKKQPAHQIMKQIQDYLQTQGLSCDADTIAVARAATQAIITNGQAHIEPQLWQHAQLPSEWQQEAHIKPLYMALDSTASRQPAQSIALYGCTKPPPN